MDRTIALISPFASLHTVVPNLTVDITHRHQFTTHVSVQTGWFFPSNGLFTSWNRRSQLYSRVAAYNLVTEFSFCRKKERDDQRAMGKEMEKKEGICPGQGLSQFYQRYISERKCINMT